MHARRPAGGARRPACRWRAAQRASAAARPRRAFALWRTSLFISTAAAGPRSRGAGAPAGAVRRCGRGGSVARSRAAGPRAGRARAPPQRSLLPARPRPPAAQLVPVSGNPRSGPRARGARPLYIRTPPLPRPLVPREAAFGCVVEAGSGACRSAPRRAARRPPPGLGEERKAALLHCARAPPERGPARRAPRPRGAPRWFTGLEKSPRLGRGPAAARERETRALTKLTFRGVDKHVTCPVLGPSSDTTKRPHRRRLERTLPKPPRGARSLPPAAPLPRRRRSLREAPST